MEPNEIYFKAFGKNEEFIGYVHGKFVHKSKNSSSNKWECSCSNKNSGKIAHLNFVDKKLTCPRCHKKFNIINFYYGKGNSLSKENIQRMNIKKELNKKIKEYIFNSWKIKDSYGDKDKVEKNISYWNNKIKIIEEFLDRKEYNGVDSRTLEYLGIKNIIEEYSDTESLNQDKSINKKIKEINHSNNSSKRLKNNIVNNNKKPKKFNQEEFEIWMETLPFPIASILYAYEIETNYDRKIKYLLHFFEAMSEFNFNLMISALSRDLDFYNKHFSKHRALNDKHFDKWFLRPSFGNWNNVGSRFAKSIRTILKDAEEKHELLKLFGNSGELFVKMITSKKLYNVLSNIAKFRNDWDGHGPLVDENEQKRRLKILKEEILNLKNIVSYHYKNFYLIAPTGSKLREGIHHTSAKKLMTTRPPFKSIEVKTYFALDIDKKYLIYKDSMFPIELLPLFDIIESPQKEQEACYFYNKARKNEVEYISYHFNKEPTISVDKNKLKNVFKIIG